jgi:uncharacterized cofD-like protein
MTTAAPKQPVYQQTVVTLGGGTGHFTILAGLRELNRPERITAIPGTWDNGGSSGRLRVESGVLPPGDIGQCLLALMTPTQRSAAQKLFNDRLRDVQGPLQNHSMVNLIFTRMVHAVHNFDQVVDAIRAIFQIEARIVPVSCTDLLLNAKTVTGRIIEGETSIDTRAGHSDIPADPISKIYFDTGAEPNRAAIQAIQQAEKIIFTPGDLYTSVLPHLLVDGIAEAINDSRAKVYFCLNLMTKPGETDGYRASDFLRSFVHYLGNPNRLDYLIANENGLPAELVEAYAKEGQQVIPVDVKNCLAIAPRVRIIQTPLARYDLKAHLLRHDGVKLAYTILDS